MNNTELEELAAKLGESPDYRILRRIRPKACLETPITSEMRQGLFIDVETTGLDPLNDEIIQLAMVRFTYTLDGKICDISEPFDRLRQPSKPIPPTEIKQFRPESLNFYVNQIVQLVKMIRHRIPR